MVLRFISTPAIGALCIVLITALVSVTPSASIADGRLIVQPDSHPWASIGRLNVAGYRTRRHCTATLVTPDTVLTARHCLRGFGNQLWADPSSVHFVAGYARGRFQAHRTGVSYVAIGQEATLVRLSEPVDLPALPVAEERRPEPGTALVQAGYSGDRSHVLTVDPACRFLGLARGGHWHHDCEAISGDSGSPLLIDGPDGLAIAAIHVGRINGLGTAEPVTGHQLAVGP